MPTLGTQEKKTHGRVKQTREVQLRIVSAVKSTTNLTVTFNQAVVLRGTPGWTTSVIGATPVSADSPAPDTVVVTFSATIAAATSMTIPVADPGVRSKRGGFVADTTFPC